MNARRVLPLAVLFGLSAFVVQAQEPTVPPSGRGNPPTYRASKVDGTLRYAQMGGQMMGQGMTGQGMMGGRGMGGQRGYGGAAPGAPGTPTTAQGGGVETVCGFSGGNPTHGAAIYAQTCVACHGADGRGRIPGTPDFTKRGGVLRKPHAALQAHILHGYSSPNSPISMPPRGGNPGLTDQDIRDVHAYLHKAFGCG